MAELQSPDVLFLLPEGAEDVINYNKPSTELLFAEDLMRFVMRQNKLSWQSSVAAYRFREIVSSAFIPEIGLAVIFLTEEQKSIIEQQYCQYLSLNLTTTEDFKFAARGIALTCFEKEYSALKFLKYCSKLTHLAVMFFKDSVTEAPVVAVNNIVETLVKKLEKEFDYYGGWESLYEECSEILDVRIVGDR